MQETRHSLKDLIDEILNMTSIFKEKKFTIYLSIYDKYHYLSINRDKHSFSKVEFDYQCETDIPDDIILQSLKNAIEDIKSNTYLKDGLPLESRFGLIDKDILSENIPSFKQVEKYSKNDSKIKFLKHNLREKSIDIDDEDVMSRAAKIYCSVLGIDDVSFNKRKYINEEDVKLELIKRDDKKYLRLSTTNPFCHYDDLIQLYYRLNKQKLYTKLKNRDEIIAYVDGPRDVLLTPDYLPLPYFNISKAYIVKLNDEILEKLKDKIRFFDVEKTPTLKKKKRNKTDQF